MQLFCKMITCWYCTPYWCTTKRKQSSRMSFYFASPHWPPYKINLSSQKRVLQIFAQPKEMTFRIGLLKQSKCPCLTLAVVPPGPRQHIFAHQRELKQISTLAVLAPPHPSNGSDIYPVAPLRAALLYAVTLGACREDTHVFSRRDDSDFNALSHGCHA